MNDMNRERKHRRVPRLLRRLAAVVTLALALILADALSPYLKTWLTRVLPGVNYHTVAEQVSHEMEKAGELIGRLLRPARETAS